MDIHFPEINCSQNHFQKARLIQKDNFTFLFGFNKFKCLHILIKLPMSNLCSVFGINNKLTRWLHPKFCSQISTQILKKQFNAREIIFTQKSCVTKC